MGYSYSYCRRYTIVIVIVIVIIIIIFFSWIVLAGVHVGMLMHFGLHNRTGTSAASVAAAISSGDVTVTSSTVSAPYTASTTASTTVDAIPMSMSFEEWLSVHNPRTGQKAQAQDVLQYYEYYATLDEFAVRKRIYEENGLRWKKLNEIPGGARYGPETEAHADRTVDEFARIVGSCYREREREQKRTGSNDNNETDASISTERRQEQKQTQTQHQNRLRTQSSKKLIDAFTTHHLSEPLTIMDIDWREHAPPAAAAAAAASSSSQPISYVTPVKNQGPHGTCWSFGAAENLEGLAVRQGHVLQNISEQEFISCCDDCQGRSADHTFEWLLEATGGVPALEDTYPYNGNASVPCRAETAPRASAVLHSWGRVVDEDTTGDAIVSALRQHGPMGLGVDAKCFHGYQSGIVRECGGGGGGDVHGHMINHAVLMVAAGTDLYYYDDSQNNDKQHDATGTSTSSATDPLAFPTSVEFYSIKNSWGGKWGEDGYVRIERGKDWWGELSVIYTE